MKFISCVLLASCLWSINPAVAQTTTSNGLDIFLSEAYSVYTEVTSILASDAQNTATLSGSSSASTTSSSSSTSAISASSSSSSRTASSTLPSSASLAGAASTSSSTPTADNGGHHNHLAIILGSVFGALALGLLILLLLICCRRRHHRARSHTGVRSPTDEVDGWRGEGSRPGSRGGLLGNRATHGHDHSMAAATAGATAPSMAEHPAFRNSHENPFVPVPPPPRRTTPNGRPDLTGGTVPGQEPFISNRNALGNGRGRNSPLSGNGVHKNHHTGEALAAGAGGAALGAAAMRHHNKNKDHDLDSTAEKRYSHSRTSLTRKPVGGSVAADGTEPLLNEKHHPLPRDSAGNIIPYDDRRNSTSLSPFNSGGHHRSPSNEPLASGAALAGAGALGGAAIADHHNHHGREHGNNLAQDHNISDVNQSGGILPHQPTTSEARRENVFGNQTHSTGLPPDYDAPYSPSSALNPTNRSTTPSHQHPSLAPLATGALVGGALAHHHDSHRHSNSPLSREITPPSHPSSTLSNHRRTSTPPNLPSRSPKRTRFSDAPFDVPSRSPNRNPHSASPSILGTNSHSNSDDSTSRLSTVSSSMPGGWRNSSDSERHLRNSGINPLGRQSPRQSVEARDFAGAGGALDRDSGIGSSTVGPVMRRSSASPAAGAERQVRLSDLRAEEAALERNRRSGHAGYGKGAPMESEWVGGNGYDGYHGSRLSRGEVVGQAL